MKKALALAVAVALLPGSSLLAQEYEAEARRAYELIANRQPTKAIKILNECLKITPRDKGLLLLRCMAHSQLKQHELAIADATAAIAIDADFAQAYAERAFSRYMSEHREAALADYERAAELDPDTQGERGDLLLDLGRPRDAIAAFERAIEIAPQWPNPYSQLGRAAMQLGDFALARKSFERANKLFGEDAYSLNMLVSIRYESGDHAGAIRAARKLVFSTRSMAAKVAFGSLGWKLDRYDIAEKQLRAVIARGQPEQSVDARLTLGNMQFARGKVEEAIGLLAPTTAERTIAPQKSAWVLLMRWCAEAEARGLQPARSALEQALKELKDVPEEVQTLAKRCLEPSLDAATSAFPPQARTACSHYWIAACRAKIAGDLPLMQSLMLRCINAGAQDYQQWKTARTALLHGENADKLEVALGVTIEPHTADDGSTTAVVTNVVTEPPSAAALQGLRVGDVITRIMDLPFTTARWRAAFENQPLGHGALVTFERNNKAQAQFLRLGWAIRP